ncbi:MAG TPA: hypothetical protein VGI78_01380 [Acetobacteraceae bacterium]
MALATQAAQRTVLTDAESSGSQSAVSWAAVIGGAVAALSITLLLVALGSGIGLTSVSPWSSANPSATTLTLLAAVWLIIVQWLSSAMGGYLAGRLRTKWVGLHTDEVFFRDTAHGFLAWALASVLVVAFATSSVSSAVSAAGRAVSGAASTVTQAAANQPSVQDGYFVDTLFRKDQPDANASSQDARAEAGRIVARTLANGNLDPGDRTYLAKLIAARTGVSQADAEKRIDDTMAQMRAAEDKGKQAADAARKASATGSFYLFFSMLIGAFIASAAGALGGRQRDD